nr:SpaH/EbpB family LPXTG-anchored major pilin [uncultured Dorea sp.]
MKKNVLKKFAAAALAAATVMSSMSVMAFAEAGTTEEKGSVTITKYMSNTGAGETLLPEDYTGVAPTEEGNTLLQGVQFAYVEVGERVQVDTAGENSSQTETQYKVTNADFLKAIGLDKTKVNTNFTQTELNTAIKAKKTDTIAFVKANARDANKKSTAAESGEVKFDNLSLYKLYVFAETDATKAALASDGNKNVNVTKVSVPFLVSLPFTEKNGTTVKDLKVYPKNSTGEDSIDKKIVEGKTEKVTTAANIGDTVDYKVTYSVPVTENGLESLVITDTMSKGLTFNESSDSVTVYNGDTKVDSKNYSVEKRVDSSTGEQIITITFTSEYCQSLPKDSTQKFTITYTATLNEKAVLGQTGNTNKVQLKYTNKGEDEKTISPDKEVKVFTYGIDLTKKGEGTDVLEGVKFELTNSENQPVNVLKNGTNNFYTPGGTSNEITTDNKGEIHIRGLKPGTYKLTETKTNDGYVLLKDPVEIVITQTNATTGEATAKVGSKNVTMIKDDGSLTAKVPLTVVNSKGFDLPVTGGRGIALFTIAGIAIVVAAGTLLFMRKRSK